MERVQNGPVSADDTGFSLIELLIVVGLTMVIAAIAMPMTGNALGGFRLSGDAHSLTSAVHMAKLRAAARFSKSRLFVGLSDRAFRIETWDKQAGAWVWTTGNTYLQSATESFSFGSVGTAPSSTQGTIGQAPMCLDADGTAIGNTACIVFNSRGIPVADAVGTTGGPTNLHALYITDGTAVFGVTVVATGVIQLWRTSPSATPSWVLQ